MLEFLIQVAAILAGVVLLLCLANNRVKDLIELRRAKKSFEEDKKHVELLERKNAAELEAATSTERAEHEKARLLKEAAEARVSAQLADNPDVIEARAEEEKRIIEARAEGRAQVARERAADEYSGTHIVEALVEAYKAWMSQGDSWTRNKTFEEWLGNIDVDDLR